MKRRSDSQVPIQQRELKRANSSLFSIATVVESSDSNDTGYAATDESGGIRCEDRPQHLLPIDGLDLGERELHPPIESSEKKQQGQQGQYHSARRRTISPSGGTSASNRTSPSSSSFGDLNSDRQKQNDDTATGTTRRSNDKATVADSPAFECSSSDDDGACTLETDKFIPVLSPKRTRKRTSDIDSTIKPTSSAASCNNRTSSSGDNATGIVFESSERHYDRYNNLHKERPLRIISVRDHLLKSSSRLLERCTVFDNSSEADNTITETQEEAAAVESQTAAATATITPSSDEQAFLNDDDYLRVHLPGYMQRLDQLTGCTCTERLDREAEQYTSVYFTPDTVAAAKNAAASLCRLVSSVVDGTLDNGFAVIRPPGHHSEAGLAGGYCVINNVAVAAAYAKEKLGVKRILIVDWDVHHGNGTQSIFLNDPDVLYFSVHRYHGGNFFPFRKNGGPTTVGTGAGEGYNVNVGWNQKGMGDDEYSAVWKLVLMPVAREYQPDLVLVSAGFDGALGDMGECCVTPSCFARLTSGLLTLAGGRVVCTLEGGYVRSVLSRCVEAVVGTLLGETDVVNNFCTRDLMEDILSSIHSGAASSIRSTMASHFPYWNCFKEYKQGYAKGSLYSRRSGSTTPSM
mmetsp:Transcript_17513/g.38010  ORF Transcript_17513/g.38010 Transcript_17513/m.38010 type:complete len:632 (+) Transcript_17513:169-2064(+)